MCGHDKDVSFRACAGQAERLNHASVAAPKPKWKADAAAASTDEKYFEKCLTLKGPRAILNDLNDLNDLDGRWRQATRAVDWSQGVS